MKNYDSVQSILDVGTSFMTPILTSQIDNGYKIIDDIDWFIFNDKKVDTIYINADSYINFDNSFMDSYSPVPSHHLCVNCSSMCQVRSIYKEEGTLHNFYKFLKIRWEGTVRHIYGYIQDLEYDVILWDTGDISLHIIELDDDRGDFHLDTDKGSYNYNYYNKDITFKKNDFDYEVISNIIELNEPPKYLIFSNNIYYTIQNNILVELTGVNELTAETFSNYGTFVFSYDLLNTLSNPKLLCWSKNLLENSELIISGKPKEPQLVEYNFNNLSSSIGIEKVKVTSFIDALFSVSFDEGLTWKYYNGITWVEVETNNEGMSRDIINNLSKEKWDEVFMATSLKIRCCLQQPDSYVDKKIYLKLLS